MKKESPTHTLLKRFDVDLDESREFAVHIYLVQRTATVPHRQIVTI